MSTTLSPNMLLPVPGVGTEAGPAYATDVNNCLTLIDRHDHTPGYGVQLGASALDIQDDLTLNSNDLTNARSVRFTTQASTISEPADLGCLYEVGVDLYFNDGNGNPIRITQSGGIAGAPGSISGLSSPASASYSPSTFTFQSAAVTPANLDGASIVLRNLVANSPGITLSPPSLVSDYTITLPALPLSTQPIQISSAGTMTAAPISVSQVDATLAGFLAPTGSITMYGGAAAPSGWLLCDGSAVSRTTYSALFSAISTAYGIGNGTSTFNIPDMRGMFPRGVTGASSNDPDASSRTAINGGNSGNNVGSVQTDQFESHTHSGTYYQQTGGGGTAGVAGYGTGAGVTGPGGVPANGGNETRPINIYVNFIIKT